MAPADGRGDICLERATISTCPYACRRCAGRQECRSPAQKPFIEFLRPLITNYPKKIFLVVDRLPAHKARSVHRFVHQVKDRLRLFFLPPYSPEINPD